MWGICGDMRDIIGEMRWGMMGCGMRDEPPPRNRPGRAAVFGPVPPIHEGRQMGVENNQRSEKKNAYF